jgi:hypothetical protein
MAGLVFVFSLCYNVSMNNRMSKELFLSPSWEVPPASSVKPVTLASIKKEQKIKHPGNVGDHEQKI